MSYPLYRRHWRDYGPLLLTLCLAVALPFALIFPF